MGCYYTSRYGTHSYHGPINLSCPCFTHSLSSMIYVLFTSFKIIWFSCKMIAKYIMMCIHTFPKYWLGICFMDIVLQNAMVYWIFMFIPVLTVRASSSGFTANTNLLFSILSEWRHQTDGWNKCQWRTSGAVLEWDLGNHLWRILVNPGCQCGLQTTGIHRQWYGNITGTRTTRLKIRMSLRSWSLYAQVLLFSVL